MNFSGSPDQMLAPDVIQAILAGQAANLGFWAGNGQFLTQNLMQNSGFSLVPQFVPPQFNPSPYYQPLAPPIFAPNLEEKPKESVKTEPIDQIPSTSEKEPGQNQNLEPQEPEKSINFVMGQLPTKTYYPTHFMRGTQLHVANGNVKKVEDLSSDDFLKCAAESTDVMVNASVVRSIKLTSPGSVQIVFETGIEKERIPLKCQIEHPFFVLGKGWCSCNPRKSGENYGLDCGELEVNDVCVVLTRKEEQEEAVAVDIVTAERDLEGYGQLARRREHIKQVYYEYVASGRMSAPPERICTNPPIRYRRTSE